MDDRRDFAAHLPETGSQLGEPSLHSSAIAAACGSPYLAAFPTRHNDFRLYRAN